MLLCTLWEGWKGFCEGVINAVFGLRIRLCSGIGCLNGCHIVLPILLLQKPSRTSKTKQHIALLERRLGLWSNGDLDELVRDGRAIQQRLPKNVLTKANSSLARSFSNLMFMGKCKATLDLLSRGEKGGILHLNDHVNPDDPLSPTVRESLVQKHPVGQPAYSSCIVPDEPQDSHPVILNP